MKLAPLAAVFLLAGCSNAANDAETTYNIVSARGSIAEKCDAAKRVRDAYLARRDEMQYSVWQSRAQLDCNEVTLVGGEMPADPVIRAQAEAAVENMEASLLNAN